MNSPVNDLSISDRLREVYERTDSREYAEALDVLEATRSTDPGNIYISALKRQLESLLSLSQDDDLSEDRRKELMEPMPGIIECAVRDNQRQSRTGMTEFPRTQPARSPLAGSTPSSPHGTEEAADRPADTGDPQKELEALKLLYFQRASKFVMKGEYEQALAEVRRVFIVDPENIIAKEYASRVEQLLQHARRLASEPLVSESPVSEPLASPDVPEETPQALHEEPVPEAEEPVRVNVEDPVHVHTQRSTAWDEEFIAPKPAAKIPEHRPTPPSSRMTVAYGDSLAVSHQRVREEPAEEEHRKPGRSKSKFFLVLGSVILTPILAGIAVAVFSPKSAEATGHAIVPVKQTQTQNSNTLAEGTIGTPVQPAPETAVPKVDESRTAAATPAVKAPPPVQEQKPKSEPVQVKSEILQQPAASDPPKTDLARAELPKADPPKSEPPKAEPQLIASATTTAKPPAEEPAFVPVEKPPQIIRLEKPEFPGFLREGQVVVRVRIDANGKPTDTQILKSSNPLFEQPVVDAVMRSQFSPAQMGQGPVAAWFIIPFKFKQ